MNDVNPQIMGIVNVTPDSFSDGGKYQTQTRAVDGALAMVEEGVHWLDIGGESTRPGAVPVSEQQELDRVIPVIQALRDRTDTSISIDTSKAHVMREAINAGANMINDVCALQQPNALEAAKACNVPIVLMHMRGTPTTMQFSPVYQNVVDEVFGFLNARAQLCIEHGIEKNKILFDPGFGFGKTHQHNYLLLKKLGRFQESGHKVLAGISRKSMIGDATGRDSKNRLAGSIAAATLAMHSGAHIIRVHDVPQSMDALRIFTAYKNADYHNN